jgi:hypothetical protein
LFYSYGENVSVAAINATELTSHMQAIIILEILRKLLRSFLSISMSMDTSKKVISDGKLVKK